MLTCLEIVNIIYMKCIEMCDEIKQKYNSTFSNRNQRENNYNYNYNTMYNNTYNSKDTVIDIDRQIVLETIDGPLFVNKNENIIPVSKLVTIDEETTLDTFTRDIKSPVSDISTESDWSVIMDDSN